MILLIGFAFLGGVVTILSPCILPILPIVLSGAVGGKRRPLGVVVGFIGSFTFFTLFLSAIVQATGLSTDILRTISVVALIAFGLFLLIPTAQTWLESLVSRFSNRLQPAGQKRSGFGGGLVIGFSLGLIWTPCVGPILAAVISLALTQSVTAGAAIIALAYAIGTAIPMFAIMIGGRKLLQRFPGVIKNAHAIQQTFGVIIILTAIAIAFNVDRIFQSYILDRFPNYADILTGFEQNDAVMDQLENLK